MITSLFVSIFLPMFWTVFESPAAHQKARTRRLAEYRLNARLLRFNI